MSQQQVCKLTTCSLSIMLVWSTVRKYGPYFESSQNSPCEISTDKRQSDSLFHTYDTFSMYLTNAHEQSRRNTLKPCTRQDFSAWKFDICGFTIVIFVVLKLTQSLNCSFCASLSVTVVLQEASCMYLWDVLSRQIYGESWELFKPNHSSYYTGYWTQVATEYSQ